MSTAHIEITEAAWRVLGAKATRKLPAETGGILIGYRGEYTVRIVGVLEVSDPQATMTEYTLNATAAQKLLDDVRRYFPADSPVGFVGDWHTHPAPAGPSGTDRRSIGRVGRRYRRRIASIVAARSTMGDWEPHGLMGTRLRVRSCHVDIINEGPP